MKPDHQIIECLPILQPDGTVVYEPRNVFIPPKIEYTTEPLRREYATATEARLKESWYGYTYAIPNWKPRR